MLLPFPRSLVRNCTSANLIGHDSCLPYARLHVLESLLWDGVQQLWPLRLSLTRLHDDFNLEELLSDLTTIAGMIRPHLGSRLFSARLTFGVHHCTLPREERFGRRTNPVKSTCTSTTPQLSERTGADACLSTLHSKIDSSELAAKGVLRARRLCCLRRVSPEGSYRGPFCSSSRSGADRRWSFGASLL